MYERLVHWPTTAEGLMWGGALYAALLYICPELGTMDATKLIALIPIIRGALAKGPATTSPNGANVAVKAPV